VALRRPPSEPTPSGIRIRQLMAGHYPSEVDVGGGPTPDGESLVGIDWETGNVVVTDLETGASRRVTAVTQAEYQTGYPGYVLVSPRGDRLAYTWHHLETPEEGPEESGVELRVVGMDGSDRRSLNLPPDVWPEGWSADGERLIAVSWHREKEETEIGWINPEDGSLTSLGVLSYPARFHTQAAPSPDDRFVAVDHPVKEDSARYDISLLSTDGGRWLPLVDHPEDDRVVGWVPGTNDLLFTSTRSGSKDLWAIRVGPRGGTTPPRPVRREVGDMGPMGFTADGSLFYSIYTLQYNLAVAPFRRATGEILIQESQPFGGIGSNMRPDWSPDGRRVVFVRRRPSPPGRGFGMKGWEEIVYVRDPVSGTERAVAQNVAPATAGAPKWFPDGESLLVLGMSQEAAAKYGEWGRVPPTLYRVDLSTGDPTPLFDLPPASDWWSAIGIRTTGNDGAVIYERHDRLVLHRLSDHREFELYPDGDPLPDDVRLTPNGFPLVFGVKSEGGPGGESSGSRGGNQRFMMIPPGGGEPQDFFQWEGPSRAAALGWAADGHAFLVAGMDDSGMSVFRVQRGPGEPQPQLLWRTPLQLRGLSISPDRAQVAYFTQENEAEIWVMENLAAALKEKEGRQNVPDGRQP
jgi:Tol biopolymer transport system component